MDIRSLQIFLVQTGTPIQIFSVFHSHNSNYENIRKIYFCSVIFPPKRQKNNCEQVSTTLRDKKNSVAHVTTLKLL